MFVERRQSEWIHVPKTQQEFGKGCGQNQKMSAETGDHMQRIQNCGEKFGEYIWISSRIE